MRDIAHAEGMAKLSAAVNALKQLPVWNQNKALRDWFLGTWLKQQKVVDVNLKTISYRDGKQDVSPIFYKNIRCFLKDQIVRRGRPFLEHQWLDEVPKEIPFQENSYDCGMFVCMFAENLSRGKNPNFHQDDMPSLRRKLKEQLQQKSL